METLVQTPVPPRTALPSIHGILTTDKPESRRGSGGTLNHSPTSFRFGASQSFHFTGQSSGLASPPQSRRSSGDDKMSNQPMRQSLPPIHEALGRESMSRESSSKYPAPPPPAPPSGALTPTTSSFRPPITTSAPAPADPTRRFAPIDPAPKFAPPPPPPPPPPPVAHQSSYGSQPASNSNQPSPTRPLPPSGLPPYSSHSSHPSPVPPIKTNNSPPPASSHYTPTQHSPSYEPSPHSAHSAPPAPYSYSNYQSGYPKSSAAGAPSYTASSYPPPSWGSRDYPRPGDGRPPAPYGESIKRSLEQFDVAATVYELAETSAKLKKFADEVHHRLYQSNRTSPLSQSVGNLREIDESYDILNSFRQNLDRLKEMVHASQSMEAPKDVHHPIQPHHPPPHGYPNGYPVDPQGFAPPPPPVMENKTPGDIAAAGKKRKGRAAPPGRCHSCKRSETPEWRRGPDGARTLCNACGLHYAKLARKTGDKNIANSQLLSRQVGSRTQGSI